MTLTNDIDDGNGVKVRASICLRVESYFYKRGGADSVDSHLQESTRRINQQSSHRVFS
jgi:hypothetical protein